MSQNTSCARLADLTGARAAYASVAKTLDDLLLRNPANLVWLGHKADALYRLGDVDRALGSTAKGSREVREALDLAVRVADNAEASTADLDRAANFLIDVAPPAWRDANNALKYAHLAVRRSNETDAASLLTLAKAERMCGRMDEARVTLDKILVMLAVPGSPPTQLGREAQELREKLARESSRKRGG